MIRRGQYTFHIREMHKKYGPILRISPYELHITDPSFIHEIYAVSNRRRDRWEWSTRPGGFNGSVGGTNPHELHRKRRAALNPFFSKASIRKLQHEIDEKAVQLVQRLRNEKERVFKVNHAYAALTNGERMNMLCVVFSAITNNFFLDRYHHEICLCSRG